MFKTLLILATLMAASDFGGAAWADMPGHHPSYLHALTDLRAARGHLEKRGGSPALQSSDHQAIGYIDQCIEAVKQAAGEDQKNLNSHPKEDAGQDKVGNVHRARELLLKVKQDISGQETNTGATAAQAQAIQYLNQALQQVEQSLTIKQ